MARPLPEHAGSRPRPAPAGGHADPRGRLVLTVTVWALALGAVVVAAVATIAVLNRTVYSPRLVVQRYADALADHDAGAALAALGLDSSGRPIGGAEGSGGSGASSAVLLGAAALSGAPSTLTAASTSGGNGASSRRDVTLHYRLAGEAHRTVFHVERSGRLFGVFDRWRIAAAALPRVDVRVPRVRTVSVNGVAVPVTGGRADVPVLYPALYVARAGSQFETAEPQQATVTAPGTVRIRLGLEPSSLLTDTVTRQVRDWLNGCTSSGVLAPAGCPFAHRTSERIDGDVEWRITRWPSVGLRATGTDRWTVTRSAGRARISGSETRLIDGVQQDFTATERFTVAGTVTRRGQVVTFSPATTDPADD